MRRTQGSWLFPILVTLAGCGPSSSERNETPSSFVQYDSAGILISDTRGPEARSPLGWAVDSVPDLVIGTGTSPHEILYRVQGLRGLPGGGVLVVDGGSREIRFYDPRGRLVNLAGGKGGGPGEFEDPVLVPSVESDSLLLFDSKIPRMQVFSEDGQLRNTIPYVNAWPAGRVPPVGAMGLHVLFGKGGFLGGEAALQGGGLKQSTKEYFWYDPTTGARNTLESFVFDWAYALPDGTSDIPFTSRPAAAVGPGGALITDGCDSEIREYDVSGQLRRIFRVDELNRPVTQEMIEKRIDAMATTYDLSRDYLARNYAEVPIPDSLPVFQSLRVDEMGWLWVEVYGWDPAQPKEWMVFDPEGRAHGIVNTPPELDLRWIGESRILGVWLDEFGVEYVKQHTLRRGVPGEHARGND